MPDQERIEVKLGMKIYYPFRGLNSLSFPGQISIPDDVNLDEPPDYVASVALGYGGSKGRLYLLPITKKSITTKDIAIPLGKVKLAKREEYSGGSKWDGLVREAPLTFAVDFEVGGFDDYMNLSEYWISLRLGRSDYLLKCLNLSGDLDETIKNYFLGRDEPFSFRNYNLYDLKGNRQSVLIPGRPKPVGRVGINFIAPKLEERNRLEAMQGRFPIL